MKINKRIVYKILIVLAVIVAIIGAYVAWAYVTMYQQIDSHAAYWQQRREAPVPEGAVRIVALGDSTAQAVGSIDPNQGIVGLTEKMIQRETGRQTHVANLSVSSVVLDDLMRDQLPAADFETADIVIVAIGGNDVTRQSDVQVFTRQISTLLSTVPVEKTIVTDVPGMMARKPYNDALLNAAKDSGVVVAKTWEAFEPREWEASMYARDWFHPSAKGYGVWFEAMKPSITELIDRQNLRR